MKKSISEAEERGFQPRLCLPKASLGMRRLDAALSCPVTRSRAAPALPSTFTIPSGNASVRLCEDGVKPPHSKAGCARKCQNFSGGAESPAASGGPKWILSSAC